MSLELAQHFINIQKDRVERVKGRGEPELNPEMTLDEYEEYEVMKRIREGSREQIRRARERKAVRDRLERVYFIRDAKDTATKLGFASHGTYI